MLLCYALFDISVNTGWNIFMWLPSLWFWNLIFLSHLNTFIVFVLLLFSFFSIIFGVWVADCFNCSSWVCFLTSVPELSDAEDMESTSFAVISLDDELLEISLQNCVSKKINFKVPWVTVITTAVNNLAAVGVCDKVIFQWTSWRAFSCSIRIVSGFFSRKASYYQKVQV